MYSSWRVSELKAELTKRGASLRGKKVELVERLELYDRNFNFGSAENQSDDDVMEVPDVRTYRDINASSLLPPLTQTHIRQYFCFDDKKINEAKALYESRYLILARVSNLGDNTFIKAYCKKTMKQLQYEVNLKLYKSGIPQESNCECPAGSGTEAKCKHVAVVLHGVEHMVHDKILLVHQVCTQKLQEFHVPKIRFNFSPIAAYQLPRNKTKKRFSPFPIQKVNKNSYNNKIRNLVLNFQNSKMPIKQLYEPANPYAVISDHSYTKFDPETELLKKLNLIDVNDETILKLEETTRGQKDCPKWITERKYRITASNLHTVCHLKDSSKKSYCYQTLNRQPFTSRATTHGILNEAVALNEYMAVYDLHVVPCGLFISKERPYLGASPDGLLGEETIVEVKCPFSSRNEFITPVTVPYLIKDPHSEMLTLKQSSPYYYQIQGQLYCTGRLYCNLIVFTYKCLEVIYVSRNEDFINSMLVKADDFYNNYFKTAIFNNFLYNDYDLIKKRI